MKKQHKVNAGLFGFGTVGNAVYTLFDEQKQFPNITISKIVVKDKIKDRNLPNGIVSYKHSDILDNEEISLVIELISESEAAFEIVKTALLAGKDVISANKKMIAEHLPELIALQQKTGRTLLYEAAVCASIPIIRLLDSYYNPSLVQSFEGVFNGTTNYMLNEMENGSSYETALQKAQKLGLAEADPTADVDGFDAKYKLAIATVHALGIHVPEKEVLNFGIRNIGNSESEFANQFGFNIRLKAVSSKSDGIVVLPCFVDQNDFSYNLAGAGNYVQLETQNAGTQILQGEGAGGRPTASAVLSDIILYQQGYKYTYNLKPSHRLNFEQSTIDIYIRSTDSEIINDLKIDRLYWNEYKEGEYITGIRTYVSELHKLDKSATVIRLPLSFIEKMNGKYTAKEIEQSIN